MKTSLLVSILLITAGLEAGIAQSSSPSTQQTPPKNPCQDDTNFRAFDFWLGDWHVRDRATGKHAGNNSITVIENGCGLHESWKSATGGTGQSLNYYNPTTGKWRQIWLATGYLIDIEGGMKDGSMELIGSITYYNNQKNIPIKGIWTPNDDGSVRQHFLQYNAETDKWDDWFDGDYSKQKGKE